MQHQHEWEHLTTQREGDECTIKHGCEYCALIMVTRLKFDGPRVADIKVEFVDGAAEAVS